MTAGPRTDANDALIGQTLGEFRLEARIGAGATGVVYRAVHVPDGRPAAVKVLNDHLGRISSLERRFRREARVLNRLDHPNIVHIYEFGVTEDATYIAMELLEGETLDARVRRIGLTSEELLTIARAIADALVHAHEHDVVHRDLKPANVFLPATGDAKVKLLDFGLAKFLAIDELSQDVTLTRKGRVVGTPAYMAPEQITGVSLDPRADIYSFGVLFFEMIADRRPFEYAKRSELLRAHLFEPAPKLNTLRPDLILDPALVALVHRALSKDPDDRFQTARELREALLALPDDSIGIASTTQRRADRPRPESSSVVISDAELQAVRTPPPRRSIPPRPRSTMRPPPSSTRDTTLSTDAAHGLPLWLVALAFAVAIGTGAISYWIGSQLP